MRGPLSLFFFSACGLALPASIVAVPPAAASASPAGSSSPATQAQAEALPFRNPDLPAEERITDLISRHDAGGEDRLHGRARLGTAARRRRLAAHRGLPRRRAGRPEQLGPAQPDADDAVPAGLRPRRDLGSRARPARRRAGGARGALPLPERHATTAAGSSSARPNADLARDPRWGRTEEVYGEDPFLVGTLATAFVARPAGRRPALLEDGGAAEALPRQQQRGRPHPLVLELRRAAVARVLRLALRARRCATAARAR